MEGIAWPAAVVLLGFGFMTMFRSSISALLGRTKKLGKTGLETFEHPQALASGEKPDPLAEYMSTYDNRLLREQEGVIQKDLVTRGLTDPAAAQKALIRSLAGTQILLAFEKVQNSIWKSQVDLLTILNARESLPVDEARPLYDAAAQQYSAMYANYSFEAWLEWLESKTLIENNRGAISITAIGREYLKWRIEDGRAGPFYG